jgi:hypothetical protein
MSRGAAPIGRADASARTAARHGTATATTGSELLTARVREDGLRART